MELVSIIVPHFNRSLLLKDTIDSVINQTFTDWEMIIIDDGSEESDWEQVKSYEASNIKIFRKIDGKKGPSGCRNVGVSKAKGKYLIFLDSDDLLADFCLKQRVAEMEKDDAADMAIFLMQEFYYKPGDTDRNYNTIVSYDKLSGKFLQDQNPWNVTCPIWRKKFFNRVGGFDENFLFMEDPELHLRALNVTGSKIKICYDKPADCYYRIHQTGHTKQNFWFNSIFYRIQFYRKLNDIRYGDEFIIRHKKDIKIGIYNLVRRFLYPKKNQFPELYIDLLKWMRESKLFSSFELVRLRYLIDIGNSSMWILCKLKVRGICFMLLPAK